MLTKNCLLCGSLFEKPKFCGMPEWISRRKFCSPACKKEYQVGKGTKKKGTGKGLGSQGGKMIPCRVCGENTRYAYSKNDPKVGKVHCGKVECREISASIKNERISETHKKQYKEGAREFLIDNWNSVKRVSNEELIVQDFMNKLGYVSQYKILTKLPNGEHPRCFWPDFALLDRKICVEIDGSSHEISGRKERDDRKDEILGNLGWKIFRFPAKMINEDISEFKRLVLSI